MLLVFVLCSVLITASVEASNSYFITAPSVFRPGQPFKLRVWLKDTVTDPVNITCGILDLKLKTVIASNSDTFANGSSKEIALQVPYGVASTTVTYTLSVNGTGGTNFSETKYVRFMEKGFSIYIQTDKAVYKPGQKVLMRIFGVHPDLKLYTGNLTVDILDPNGNKMAHWVNVNSQSGVIKKEFLLSTQPVEGNWKISVTAAKDQKAEQVIEVKPYVLPKFEVKVNLPDYALEKDKYIHGSVDVKYTYGKGAKGRANIQLYFNTYSWHQKKLTYAKDVPVVDGHGKFSFRMKDINQLFKKSFGDYMDESFLYKYGYRMEVNATFYEDLTGKKAAGLGSISFHEIDVKLQWAEFNPENFRPGLPYTALVINC